MGVGVVWGVGGWGGVEGKGQEIPSQYKEIGSVRGVALQVVSANTADSKYGNKSVTKCFEF